MTVEEDWISQRELAGLVKITVRQASRAMNQGLNGKTWRGHQLVVRKIAARGRGGVALQVAKSSLPKSMRDAGTAVAASTVALALQEPPPRSFPAPTAPAPGSSVADAGVVEASVAAALRLADKLAEAASHPRWSRSRAAALRDISADTGVPLRTLRAKMANYEQGNFVGLMRKARADKGHARYHICRSWDSACPLQKEKKQAIADAFKAKAPGLVQKFAHSGERNIMTFFSANLVELSRAYGWKDCNLSSFVLSGAILRRYNAHRDLNTKLTDAKCWSDKKVPRVARTSAGKQPTALVYGDVHPADVPINMPDGRQEYARLIGWHDVATDDLFLTVVFVGKAGVTQADIEASFVQMCMAWGIPERLGLDNGSEYCGALIKAFDKLSGVIFHRLGLTFNAFRDGDGTWSVKDQASGERAAADASCKPKRGVSRSRPHSPQGKPIEALWARMERCIMSLISGWVAGDRLKKRTHKVGKQPKGYPGTPDEFVIAVGRALDYYRVLASEGNPCPNERKQAAIDDGWRPRMAPIELLLVGLGEVKRPKVQNGGIEVNGRWYNDDILHRTPGRRIAVKCAKWYLDHVVSVDGAPRAIPLRKVSIIDDTAGAIEQSRMKSEQDKYFASIKVDTRDLSAEVEMARVVALSAPAPQLPAPIPVLIGPEHAAQVDALQNAQAAPVFVLQPGQVVSPIGGDVVDIGPTAKPPQRRVTPSLSPPNPRALKG